MKRSETNDKEKKKITEVKTFPVPFPLRENQENIAITTNTPSKPSKEQLINQAIKFHRQGNIREASKYYQYCLDQGFNDQRVFSNYGVILKNLGNLQEAEFFTQKAIELNPDFAEAHSNLGVILKDLGKLKEAELSCRKAIEINPNFAEAHSNLGDILNDLSKYKEAKDSWFKAIELEPNLKGTVEQLARRLYLDRQYDLAIKYLRNNKSDTCQSLYLSCLLCLNKEKEYDQKYQDLSAKEICNAEMSGIIEHANIIYEKKNKSHFCNDAINYIFVEKINEELFSENHCNQLISYLNSDEIEKKPQPLIHEAIQTTDNLFSLDYPFIKSIKKALELQIELYKAKFKDSEQGFIKNWPVDYTLRAWMLAMKTGGFIEQHNHRYGWITGSFYLQVPKKNDNSDAGNISFSYQGPQYPMNDKIFNSTVKKIETRDICIFPSSLFHQTIPFDSQEDRICLVFDLIQLSTNK